MKINNKAFKVGDNIDTDVIIPARYLNSIEPSYLAKHCLRDIDPLFGENIKERNILVAGRNFGCGSSREHAPLALKAASVQLIIASSFARIFYRNALNIGLAILECPEIVRLTEDGDDLEINLSDGSISNLTRSYTCQVQPFSSFMQSLTETGGLINFLNLHGLASLGKYK